MEVIIFMSTFDKIAAEWLRKYWEILPPFVMFITAS